MGVGPSDLAYFAEHTAVCTVRVVCLLPRFLCGCIDGAELMRLTEELVAESPLVVMAKRGPGYGCTGSPGQTQPLSLNRERR